MTRAGMEACSCVCPMYRFMHAHMLPDCISLVRLLYKAAKAKVACLTLLHEFLHVNCLQCFFIILHYKTWKCKKGSVPVPESFQGSLCPFFLLSWHQFSFISLKRRCGSSLEVVRMFPSILVSDMLSAWHDVLCFEIWSSLKKESTNSALVPLALWNHCPMCVPREKQRLCCAQAQVFVRWLLSWVIFRSSRRSPHLWLSTRRVQPCLAVTLLCGPLCPCCSQVCWALLTSDRTQRNGFSCPVKIFITLTLSGLLSNKNFRSEKSLITESSK